MKQKIYNLIILDESGSMRGVTAQTISGCNETLNTIRKAQKDNAEQQEHYVSIYAFDDSKARYLRKNEPIDKIANITFEDYQPEGCTPLYDAIGNTCTELHHLTMENKETCVLVTIITDGMENASRTWSYEMVHELIENLKAQDWMITFIGANIDVKRVSADLGIMNCMKFTQDEVGTHEMFERESRARTSFFSRMAFSHQSSRPMKAKRVDYFAASEERIASDHIKALEPNEIFVFGSNKAGMHYGGAARFAHDKFGAVMGQGEGLQGQSYAIPTMGSMKELEEAVANFTKFVYEHPELKFMLTAVGCGIAGYTPEQIAPLFKRAYLAGNLYVPKSFLQYIDAE